MKSQNPFEIKKPWVIAHRGYSGLYPENTILAFKKAIEANANWIELDISLSKDREVIVLHDDTLDRTTNLKGMASDFNCAELAKAEAGTWKDSKFTGEGVPTLWEVWDLVANSSSGLNVEIKSSAYEPGVKKDSIEAKVIRYAEDKKLLQRTLFSSFSWDSLAKIRELCTDAKIGILVGDNTPWEEALDIAFRLNAVSINLPFVSLTSEIVSSIHQEGFLVLSYTLNSEEEIRSGLLAGVDGIFTNFPERMSKLLT
ncbi:glycerophosphodiester phosphodiesterase [Leptospira perolatii]|uniref:Glycerophosphodiester phosphodiesterase n=1 Tax=Leptospira perolatii TaxID=2023191 RepID=A0A2M9ZS67_9LEPT|nr:glycerophosphodiester phosphodiesterase family protein [Leptospira perolatii]PJZ71330.1 glycerophosphodiester phosphodiesterase [Leptospira perolatii]PJZ74864.1 glycerophosphodiester phosphodiesterase [Leptospira perolatii]